MSNSPKELYDLGVKLCKEEKFEQAIPVFEQAESTSTDGKYPDASNAKGFAFHNLEQYDLALTAYEKALSDSPDGIFPKALNCKGATLFELKKFDDAIEAFKKGANEGSKEERVQCYFNLGIVYKKLAWHKEALFYFEKAESDSYEGKYPEASFKRGEIFRLLNNLEEAIRCFEKAESDSSLSKHPLASNDKGVCLYALGLFEEAYVAFQKAEEDSINGIYPMASCNKGAILSEMHDYVNAIQAFTKSEKESDNEKNPDASFFKGICLIKLNLITEGVNSLKKAIRDSVNQVFPSAHLSLAECELGRNFEFSKEHAFIALTQDPRDISIVSFIHNNFSSPATGLIYQNRLKYLHHINTQVFDTILLQNYLNDFQINHKIRENDYTLLSCLLCSKNIEIPFQLNRISRLRLAYLINYSEKEVWRTFYIIDELIDREFDLDEMDCFFYLLSAYEIGEPVDEILSIVNSNKENPAGKFDYHELVSQINSANNSNNYLDSYLLDLKFEIEINDLSGLDYSSHIINALKSIINQQPINLPLERWAISGLLVQLLDDSIGIDELTLTQDNNSYLLNFQNSLSTDELNYSHLLTNIRSAISSAVSYKIILKHLFKFYQNTKSEKIRKNIAILQCAVMLSIQLDLERRSLNKRSLVRHISMILLDLSVDKAIASIFQTGAIFNLGLLIAIDFVMKTPMTNAIEKWDKKIADQIFERLLSEIESNNNEWTLSTF
jgi:tetratricopeptide (TPR) repeat protein